MIEAQEKRQTDEAGPRGHQGNIIVFPVASQLGAATVSFLEFSKPRADRTLARQSTREGSSGENIAQFKNQSFIEAKGSRTSTIENSKR